MKRLLGLDYGQKRVGVALSDPGRRIASPHSVLAHGGWGPTARAVQALMEETGAEYVVLGLPYDMDDSLGGQAREVQGFAEALRKRGLKVAFQDERLTSFQAEDSLKAAGKTARQAKGLVDQVAAALILQAYLDAHSQNRTAGQEDQGRGAPEN